MSAKKANSDNESSVLQLFYEYLSLCLFAGKKTIVGFRYIKDSFFEIQSKSRERIY